MILVATFNIGHSFDFAHVEGEHASIVPNRNFAHIMVAFIDHNFSFTHIMVTFADQNFNFARIMVAFINHNFSFVRIKVVVACINLNNCFDLTYSFTDFHKVYFV